MQPLLELRLNYRRFRSMQALDNAPHHGRPAIMGNRMRGRSGMQIHIALLGFDHGAVFVEGSIGQIPQYLYQLWRLVMVDLARAPAVVVAGGVGSEWRYCLRREGGRDRKSVV